jgi:hypothetical protein
MTMADSAIDRALAVFRAYAKTGVTGVTGVTGENLPNKLRHLTSVTPVTPIGAQGVTGVTSNNQNKSVASASVTPVTRATPQKTIVRKEVNPVSFPYADALDRLKKCPEYVDVRSETASAGGPIVSMFGKGLLGSTTALVGPFGTSCED